LKEENGDAGKDIGPELKMTKADLEVQQLLMDSIKFGGTRVTRARATGRTPKSTKSFSSFSKKRKSTDGGGGGGGDGDGGDGEGDEEEGKKKQKTKKKGGTKANKPKDLSPALAEFMGEEKMTRPDVVKRLHEYFKEHNLQNPKNKRQILLDDKLQQVFKKKTTDYFQLNSLLSKHLTDPGELL